MKAKKPRASARCPPLRWEAETGGVDIWRSSLSIFNTENTKENRRKLKKEMTEAELLLWKYIRNDSLGVRFRRQYGIGYYIADFYSPSIKLVIELDGSGHFTPEGLEYDKIREKFMKSLGIKTLRFNNNDVLTNIEGVLEEIKRFV